MFVGVFASVCNILLVSVVSVRVSEGIPLVSGSLGSIPPLNGQQF